MCPLPPTPILVDDGTSPRLDLKCKHATHPPPFWKPTAYRRQTIYACMQCFFHKQE